MTLLDYLKYFDEIMQPTEGLFRLVTPDKLDWKPTESSFTAGQLMAHIGGALGAYGRGIATGQWRFSSFDQINEMNKSTPSIAVEAAVENFKKNHIVFKEMVGALSEAEFQSGEVDTPQLGRVKRWRIAMFAIEHHLNHKAELFMYLKMIGIPVTTLNLYLMK